MVVQHRAIHKAPNRRGAGLLPPLPSSLFCYCNQRRVQAIEELLLLPHPACATDGDKGGIANAPPLTLTPSAARPMSIAANRRQASEGRPANVIMNALPVLPPPSVAATVIGPLKALRKVDPSTMEVGICPTISVIARFV